MERLQRDSVLISLIEALRNRGSWCGEAHLQLVTYFLQELLKTPLGFQFILYKHGPYSFDLCYALAQMEADFMVEIVPLPRYRASFTLGETSNLLKEKFPITIAKYQKAVNFVVEKLAEKNVSELQRVATAMYVSLDNKTSSQTLAQRIKELTPHVSLEEACQALNEFEQIRISASTIRI
jgi:hypothetical protein